MEVEFGFSRHFAFSLVRLRGFVRDLPILLSGGYFHRRQRRLMEAVGQALKADWLAHEALAAVCLDRLGNFASEIDFSGFSEN